MGSDRTRDTSSHLLAIALFADFDPLLHHLAVVADQVALGGVPIRGGGGFAPGANVVVASLRKEEICGETWWGEREDRTGWRARTLALL